MQNVCNIEFILEVKIKKLAYTNDQEMISSDVLTAKSIRLDVYVEDEAGTIYDIEVQTYEYKLPRERDFRRLSSIRKEHWEKSVLNLGP